MAKRSGNEMTPEEAKKAEKKAMKKQKRENLQKLVNMLIEAGVGGTVTEEMVTFATEQRKGSRTGGGRTGAKNVVGDLFDEVGVQYDEDSIWNELKLGRLEMRKASVQLIKKAPTPEERKWISFDAEQGIYTLEAIGSEAPENWTGYRPVVVEDIEIQ